MKKLLRNVLLVFAIMLTLLIAATWILIKIYKTDIRLKAEQAIDDHLNAIVTFDDVTVSVFKDFPNLTVTLHDLEALGKGRFEGDTLAWVEELDIEINTSSYLKKGEIELNSVHLNKPILILKVSKNGAANFDIFKPDTTVSVSPDSSSLHLAIDQVRISDGRIEYHDHLNHLMVLAEGFNHTGRGDFQKEIFDFTTRTTCNSLTLDYGRLRYLSNKEVEIDLVMETDLGKKVLTLKENRFRVNHFKFDMKGKVALLANGYDFDLDFGTQETDFKNIISLVPGIFMKDFQQISTAGELAFKGYLRGVYTDTSTLYPTFMAGIEVSKASFKIDSLPDPIDNIHMDLQISNMDGHRDSTVWDIRNFQFNLRKHPISGKLRLQGMDKFTMEGDVKASLDLREIERMYPVGGIDLDGDVTLEVKARGPLEFNGDKFHRIPTFSVDMRVKDGRFKYDHLPAAIDSIQFHLMAENKTGDIEKTVFDFRHLHMDMGQNVVHGYAKFEGYRNLQIKTDLKAKLDLADLERMFPVSGLVLKGNLNLDARAEGTYNQALKRFPAVDARLELKDGFLQSSGYPEPLEAVHLSGEILNITGNFADTRMSIQRLTYTLEDEPFEVRGTISDLNEYNYDLIIKGLVNLEKISKFYPIPGLRLEGIIISDVETHGKLTDLEAGRYERTSSDGDVEIKDLVVQGPFIKNRIAISDALFTISPTKVTLQKFNGKLGRSQVSLKGDLMNYMSFVTRNNDLITCDLDLKCDTLDINEWMPDDTSPQPSGNGPVPTDLPVIPRNVDFVFDSDIDHLMYQDMKLHNVKGEIRMKDGVMTLNETGFDLLDAKFSLSGDYNTQNLSRPFFDMDLDIKNLDINKAYKEMKLVRDLASAAGDTYGQFSVNYKLKGELQPGFNTKTETLVGEGEIRIADAKVNGMKIFEELSKAAKKQEVNDPHLRDFVMKTEIRDNKIIVKPFSIKVSGLDADIEGVSEVSGAVRYLIKLEILKLKIPFHVTGTYDKPKVAIGKGHVIQASDSLPQ